MSDQEANKKAKEEAKRRFGYEAEALLGEFTRVVEVLLLYAKQQKRALVSFFDPSSPNSWKPDETLKTIEDAFKYSGEGPARFLVISDKLLCWVQPFREARDTSPINLSSTTQAELDRLAESLSKAAREFLKMAATYATIT